MRFFQNNQKMSIPDFQGIQQWFNTHPLNKKELMNKVVLIDFWTYSCLNCQRTIPYLRNWWEKYRDQGYLQIGIHTPEFEFEKDPQNLKKALKDLDITWPVVQDNNYIMWDIYHNRYWPAKYFFDHHGNLIWRHFGEGAYQESEELIQQLLKKRGELLNSAPAPQPTEVDFTKIKTPELYLGYERMNALGNNQNFHAHQTTTFQLPQEIKKNKFYLSGDWQIEKEKAVFVGKTPGKLLVSYEAKQSNLVLGGPKPNLIEIKLDSQPLNENNKGQDVRLINNKSFVEIQEFRLYNLVNAPDYNSHVLEIIINQPGLQAFAFNFG